MNRDAKKDSIPRASCFALAVVLILASCGPRSGPETSSTLNEPGAITTSAESTEASDADVLTGVAAVGSTVKGELTTKDGSPRTYRIYLAASLPTDEAVPLLIALHGGTGSGEQFEANSDFDELAEANGFIVVYPDGIEIAGLATGRAWNGGSCCGSAQEGRDDVDDVGFIAALIDTLEANYTIDSGKVFATGHSNGAILSYRLACELSDRIVAVAFQAGSLEIDDCVPSNPVSLLHIHGSEDANLPIDGGQGSGISNTDFTSPKASVDRFAEIMECSDKTETVNPENAVVTHLIWENCSDDAMVEMAIVEGANHAWMGHPGSKLQSWIVGPPFLGYDSSFAIWSFLHNQAR